MRVHVLLLMSMCALVVPAVSQAAQQGPKPAQQPAKATPATKSSSTVVATTGDLDEIVELVKTGVPQNLIIKTIQNGGKVYKLAPADVLRLKKAGVGDAIIEAMVDTAGQSKGAPAPSPAPAKPAPTVAAAPQPSSPGDREPTEAEMYAALKAGYANTNAMSKETEEACRNGSFRTSNDPGLAMMCLAGALGTGGQGGISVDISGFRKIACAKAGAQPGWNCDYVANIDTTGLVSTPFMKGMMSNNVLQGRFLYTSGQWVKMPN